ncbi:cofilin [Dimargaris verticillata]|uniref:Cofilin n=1 Tax=Dimargaris verticillata TaxID=2761393 RepID=A0A9W8AZZ9_9FUNG|nr:cofilin [Dimargaris verticillata]
MSSGVGVNNECLDVFQQLKSKRAFKYVIYKLSDDKKEIVVDSKSDNADYDDFVAALPPKDCRYAVYDFEYERANEGKRNKICFFIWSPDEAPIKSKMLYASSKDAIRKRLDGIAIEVQGTDLSEVAYETVLEKATRTSR